MTDALQDAIDQVITALRDLPTTLPALRKVFDDPPETITAFPASVVYAEAGVWKIGPVGVMTGLHNVVVELHFDRDADLAHTVQAALKFAQAVPSRLLAAFLANELTALQTFEDITYTFGPLGWGGKATIGFKWTMRNVKMQSTIT